MKFYSEIEITFNDLSYEKQEEICESIAESIRDDEELMSQIREEETVKWNELPEEFRLKMSLEKCIDLAVKDLAEENCNRFKEYIILDFEINL